MKLTWMLEKAFTEGLQEYRARRSALASVIHPSNTSPVDGIEDALSEIAGQMEAVLGPDSQASRCAAIALSFERHEGATDPENRFYFRGHVPIVAKLEGDHALLHDVVMSELARRMGRAPVDAGG